MLRKFFVAVLFTLAIQGTTVAEDMTSTPEEFQELGSLLVGRWSGDITLIADWPGFKKKKGEKLVGYRNARWVADKRAIVDSDVGGQTTGTGFWTYVPTKKQIRTSYVDSAGTYISAIVWKESKTKWGFKLVNTGLADGRKQEGSGHIKFSDDGRTYAIVSKNMTLGGKAIGELNDIYRRLDK